MTEHATDEPHRLDALGEPVYIDDVVAYAGGDSSRMRFGKVIGFTPLGVRLFNFTQGGNPRAEKDYNRLPVTEKIIRHPDQILLIRANESYRNVSGIMLRELFPDNH